MKKILILSLLILSGCSSGESSSVNSTGQPVATLTNDGVIQLNWNASAGSPDGYYVEQSLDGKIFNQVQTVTVTNAVIVNAARDKTYHFRIRAYNSGGTSPYSAVVDVTP